MDKILLVDSSVENTDWMSRILQSKGYEIYTAESGLNAIAKIKLFRPDIVILDSFLSDISGYDTCKRIKDDPITNYVLVLFVSSLPGRETHLRAVEVGADDFIEKNFDAHTLYTKIKSLLRVKHMSDQLRQKYTELEEKNAILDMQLKMSRQVQRSLIPDLDIKFNKVRFVSSYLPALDIGGDFYDVVKLNDTCISVVMCDVSGHGISAALLTAMLSMMYKNLATRYSKPDQLLYHMNNEFYLIFENSYSEMYACVFSAVIDTKEKTIHYSNAGQALPVFVDNDGNQAFELESSGLPIGLMRNSVYEFKTQPYNEGDLLLFQTDGLCDVFYKDNPLEFADRIKEELLDCRASEPNEIIRYLLDAFYNFEAKNTVKMGMDDVSLVLCKM